MIGQNKEIKKRRHGPSPRPPGELRTVKISVFFTSQEASEIQQRASVAAISPAAYLRSAGLTRLPRPIPALNREAWADLARVGGNINQYQAAINEGRATGYPPEILCELRDLVQALRRDLLGVTEIPEEDDDEGDEQN